MSGTFKKTWSVPALLALITVFGLIAALLETGIWAILARLAMTAPLATILWKIRLSKP